MGTSGGAAVGVVTELVDVETTLGVGVVAGDVPGDGGGGVLVGLLEGDGAGDLRVTTEDSNCGGALAGVIQVDNVAYRWLIVLLEAGDGGKQGSARGTQPQLAGSEHRGE